MTFRVLRILMTVLIGLLMIAMSSTARADDDAVDGGHYLLFEVAMKEAQAAHIEQLWPELRDVLGTERDKLGFIMRQTSSPNELRVHITNDTGTTHALDIVRRLDETSHGILASHIEARVNGQVLIIRLNQNGIAAVNAQTMQQTLDALRGRLNEFGTTPAVVARQGADRIAILIFGVEDPAELFQSLATRAQLTFHNVLRETRDADVRAGTGNTVVPALDDPGLRYVLDRRPVVTGDDFEDVSVAFDFNGNPAISFRFNPAAARRFGDYTLDNIGTAFAIVLDGQVISAPIIQSHIPGGSGLITGNFTVDEVTEIVVLLRAGRLPARLRLIEQRVIGPALQRDKAN